MKYLSASLLILAGSAICLVMLIAPDILLMFEPYQGPIRGVLCGLGFALFCKGLELGLHTWNAALVTTSETERQKRLQEAEARRKREEEQRIGEARCPCSTPVSVLHASARG